MAEFDAAAKHALPSFGSVQAKRAQTVQHDKPPTGKNDVASASSAHNPRPAPGLEALPSVAPEAGRPLKLPRASFTPLAKRDTVPMEAPVVEVAQGDNVDVDTIESALAKLKAGLVADQQRMGVDILSKAT